MMRTKLFIEKHAKLLFFVLCVLFYTVFAIADGPVWCRDSASYATMGASREPGYPLFLLLFRTVFGETRQLYGEPVYLFPVILVQSLLWAYAAWKLGITVYEEFAAAGQKKHAGAACFFAAGLQMAVPLLNRFAAIRGSMYSESIMTESLAMPLYVLLSIRIWKWVRYEKKFDYGMVLLDCFLLISIRKQMMIGLFLFLAVSFLKNVIRSNRIGIKNGIGKFILSLFLSILVLTLANGFDHSYNFILRGVWMEHTGNSKAVLCTLLFSSDESDAVLFDHYGTLDEKALFLDIIGQAQSKGLLIGQVPKGADWVTLAEHYADSYDVIGFEIEQPVIRSYVKAHYDLDDLQAERKMDEIGADIAGVLIHQDKRDLLKVYAANLIKGLICSDARVMPVLNGLGLLFYLFYLFLYILVLRRRHMAVAQAAEVVLGGILLNTIVVGAIIFPQPRYMAYGMGLFYLILLLMSYVLFVDDQKKSGT